MATHRSGRAAFKSGKEHHLWPAPRFIGYSSASEDTTSPSTKAAKDLRAMIDFFRRQKFDTFGYVWHSLPRVVDSCGYDISVHCHPFQCRIWVPHRVGPLDFTFLTTQSMSEDRRMCNQ